MKAIGPTFSAELIAAGIDTDGIAWGSDGSISFSDGTDPAKIAAVNAVYAAHKPLAAATARGE